MVLEFFHPISGVDESFICVFKDCIGSGGWCICIVELFDECVCHVCDA